VSDWIGSDSKENLDIAIIGMACRFPGAENIDEFWRNLCEAKETIEHFTDQELESFGVDRGALDNPDFVKAGSILRGIDLFDAAFFGYSPNEASVLDPQHRIFLECAWHALENAGYEPERQNSLIGVYAGMSLSTYLLYNLLANPRLASPEDSFQIMIGNDKDFLSSRVSYELNLRGPSLDVQTGCSTSLVAVHLACQGLLTFQCDMALAGGISIQVPQRTGYYYQPGGISSPDGHCRAFDAKAEGTIFGSGVGIVALKRLTDALADRDNVLAVIKGSAINNDGSSKIGYTAPGVDGQTRVISMAQSVANVDAESITYIETHGTATALGDPVEVTALTNAFRASTDKKRFCAIGSVKTNIGHLDAAAGVASLIKTVLALKHKKVPPSLHFREANPKIDFENSPFYVNTELREWEVRGHPRRAGVSAFGIGGTNAHLILEEGPEYKEAGAEGDGWEAVLISARTEGGLEQASGNLAGYLREHPETGLGDLAYTLQVGRKAFSHRRVIVSRGVEEAVRLLEGQRPDQVQTYYQEGEHRPVVFMFPGGGAQYVGMGRGLYERGGEYREAVEEGCEMLKEEIGYDLREVMYAEKEEERARKEMVRPSVGLPALFVTEYAMARQWMKWGIRPEGMIGHSMGEYVAATIGGVFSLVDALRLVVKRGELFEELESGGMVSVGKSEEEMKDWLGERLSIAAINGPRQVVVAGRLEDVEELEREMEERGEDYRRIHIEVAAHSWMVEPILGRFEEYVGGLERKDPKIRMISNVSGKWLTEEEAKEAGYWRRHLREGVRFWAGLEEIRKEVGGVLLEVGPGQNLSRLARMSGGRGEVIVSSMRHVQEGEEEDEPVMMRAAGKLWGVGVGIEWEKVHEGEGRRRIEAPGYPFERKRYWIERASGAGAGIGAGIGVREGKRKDIGEWFYVPVWKQRVRREVRGAEVGVDVGGEERGGREEVIWVVMEDEKGIGAEVVRKLRAKGERVVRVKWGEESKEKREDEWEIDGGKREGYEEIMKKVEESGRAKARLVHMWSMRGRYEGKEGSWERFEEEQERGCYSLLRLGQALIKRGGEEEVEITVVMEGVWGVESGDRGRPEKATVVGGCKVIGQEGEGIRCRVIDIGEEEEGGKRGEEQVERLVKELEWEAEEEAVALRGSKRWVLEYEQERVEGGGELREGGVYVITGGYGGIGLLLGDYITRGVKGKLVLVGRRELGEMGEQGEEKRKKIEEMKGGGGEVMELKGDVTSEEDMTKVVELTCDRWGRIDGWIHAAGIAGEKAIKLIHETDEKDCEEHFFAKVRGACVLGEVLGDTDIDFCLLMSSNAAILGGLGSFSYSSANCFLDAFATNHSGHPVTSWISANWDGWLLEDDRRLSSSYQTSLDQFAMIPEESTEAFRRVIASGISGQVVVSTGNLAARLDMWVRSGGPKQREASNDNGAAVSPRPPLGSAYVPPSNETEQVVAKTWEDLLGIDRLGVHDNFFELGGNSLIGLKVISRLRKELNADIPMVALFEGPTVKLLSKIISSNGLQTAGYEANRSRGERRREKRLQKQKHSRQSQSSDVCVH
jgi:phthiocerol/phenolphthiocerol synthesis type-I polyketide synthase E